MTAIGVDLDGVLNNQTEHFCRTLRNACGKRLLPGEITMIPVRHLPGITYEDERAVFQSLSYWQGLEPAAGARETLQRLRTNHCMIHVYTKRPWPDWNVPSKHDRRLLVKEWRGALSGTSLGSVLPVITKHQLQRLGERAMGQVTKKWLRVRQIPYDRLVLEPTESRGHQARTRFDDAEDGRFQYFVEDDPANATRLAQSCSLVFLLSQPYNAQASGVESVVRVNSWAEIAQRLQSAGI